MFRGLIIILCLIFCCSCQTTSKQLYQEAIAPAYAPAPVAAQIQALPKVSSPVVIEEPVSTTADSCFAGAFDFMDYWGNTETTQVTMSADRGGAVKTAIEYSGLKLF